jgi:hypothetical protein
MQCESRFKQWVDDVLNAAGMHDRFYRGGCAEELRIIVPAAGYYYNISLELKQAGVRVTITSDFKKWMGTPWSLISVTLGVDGSPIQFEGFDIDAGFDDDDVGFYMDFNTVKKDVLDGRAMIDRKFPGGYKSLIRRLEKFADGKYGEAAISYASIPYYVHCKKRELPIPRWVRPPQRRGPTYGELFTYLTDNVELEPAMSRFGLPGFASKDNARQCNHTLKNVYEFCAKRGVDFEAVREELYKHAGFCDCEALLNAIQTISFKKPLPLKRR